MEESASRAAEAAQRLRVPVPDKVPTPARPLRSLELKQFLCGALAGGAAGAAAGPLEGIRTKVIARREADSTLGVLERASEDPRLRANLLRTNFRMAVALSALGRGVQFQVYESVKAAAQQSVGRDPRALPLPPALPGSSLAGAAGALASTLATYPMTVASDHMSLQPGKYSGLCSALLGIARTYGAAELFRGIVPKLCAVVPSGAITFYTFDALKHSKERGGKRKMTALDSLGFGALAGLAATLVTYPLELMRKEINMSILPPSATPTGGRGAYNNMFQALLGILRREGFFGLYRGVMTSALAVIPHTAISFAVYEASKRILVAQNQERLDQVKG